MLATMRLPLPPSVNSYWNNFRGRTILSKQGRDYKQAVQEYVAENNIPKFNQQRLHAIITIFPRDKRKIDLDNRLKALLDSLQDAGVFDDDEQFDQITITRGVIKSGGQCTIILATIEDEA
jgi:crossover junction endodeoxyribonuclease RusA